MSDTPTHPVRHDNPLTNLAYAQGPKIDSHLDRVELSFRALRSVVAVCSSFREVSE